MTNSLPNGLSEQSRISEIRYQKQDCDAAVACLCEETEKDLRLDMSKGKRKKHKNELLGQKKKTTQSFPVRVSAPTALLSAVSALMSLKVCDEC